MKQFIFAIIVISLCSKNIIGQPLSIYSAGGQSLNPTSQAGAIFLIIYPGARPVGMGGAFTAVAEDAYATYFNDAGLGFQKKVDVTNMHANWLPGLYPGMYYEFWGLALPVPEHNGGLGCHIIYLTTGVTQATDSIGKTIASWQTYDFSFKLSCGMKTSKNLSVGVGAKFIYSYLCPYWVLQEIIPEIKGGGTGISWAYDFSILYRNYEKRFTVGASLQNLGLKITYSSGEPNPLPMTLRVGAAHQILQSERHRVLLSVELTNILVGIVDNIKDRGWKYIYDDTWKAIGFEYDYSHLVFLRLGYFSDKTGYRVGPTFGLGAELKGFKFDIGIDSWIYDFPTSNYRFSFGCAF